jgi:hypothetical protein
MLSVQMRTVLLHHRHRRQAGDDDGNGRALQGWLLPSALCRLSARTATAAAGTIGAGWRPKEICLQTARGGFRDVAQVSGAFEITGPGIVG